MHGVFAGPAVLLAKLGTPLDAHALHFLGAGRRARVVDVFEALQVLPEPWVAPDFLKPVGHGVFAEPALLVTPPRARTVTHRLLHELVPSIATLVPLWKLVVVAPKEMRGCFRRGAGGQGEGDNALLVRDHGPSMSGESLL